MSLKKFNDLDSMFAAYDAIKAASLAKVQRNTIPVEDLTAVKQLVETLTSERIINSEELTSKGVIQFPVIEFTRSIFPDWDDAEVFDNDDKKNWNNYITKCVEEYAANLGFTTEASEIGRGKRRTITISKTVANTADLTPDSINAAS